MGARGLRTSVSTPPANRPSDPRSKASGLPLAILPLGHPRATNQCQYPPAKRPSDPRSKASGLPLAILPPGHSRPTNQCQCPPANRPPDPRSKASGLPLAILPPGLAAYEPVSVPTSDEAFGSQIKGQRTTTLRYCPPWHSRPRPPLRAPPGTLRWGGGR